MELNHPRRPVAPVFQAGRRTRGGVLDVEGGHGIEPSAVEAIAFSRRVAPPGAARPCAGAVGGARTHTPLAGRPFLRRVRLPVPRTTMSLEDERGGIEPPTAEPWPQGSSLVATPVTARSIWRS
jgi:hypothetical protein